MPFRSSAHPVAMASTLALVITASCAHHRGATENRGRVEFRSFHSETLGVDKDVVVYLPQGYDQHPERRYPVFYYLHGLGGAPSDWTDDGHLDSAADALGLQAIVVMPDGDDSFYIDSDLPADFDACLQDGTGLLDPTRNRPRTCVRTNHYETYLTHDVIGWVDQAYRTLPSREGRAIAGYSMGGYGALMLGMRHPDLFAAAASHSGLDALLYDGPHPYVPGHVKLIGDARQWGRSYGAMGQWMRDHYGPDLQFWRDRDPAFLADRVLATPLALYLDCGTEDDLLLDDGARYLHDRLVANHIEHSFFLGHGHHDFDFWSARVPFSLTFLRDHTAAATPSH